MIKVSETENTLDSTRLIPMRDRHLSQIADIHEQINPSPWSIEQWQACCDNALYINWVVEDAEQIVAFASYIYSGPEAELLNIGVKQNQQGKGFGEGLLRASLLLLPEGTKHCFLEVRRSNLPAIALYQKLGFEPVAERKDYYRHRSGLIEDALVFRKSL